MTTPTEWTSLKLIQWTADYFEKKGIPNPRLDAELLLAHVLKCKRIDLYIHHEKIVGEKELASFRTLIERRATREPLQYITGETEFWGLTIKVTPDVLIPRPETELLVEEALKIGAAEILDIGTGSGCIAITLAKNLPNAHITATDIAKEALEVARKNAEASGVADRIEFVLADVAPWKSFEAANKTFDLIVSNPPYIATHELDSLQPEVSRFEPRQALDGGEDGLLCIRKILDETPPFMKKGAALILEIGEGEDAWIKKTVFPSLELTEIRKDYNDIPRIVILKKT